MRRLILLAAVLLCAACDHGNAMPEMGLGHDQVRKIVDYPYTME